uniref:Endoplasmic reticulum-golgi intermediate compartment 1 n=1 Tax=Homo sapiens TaxID=9606 RepID=A0A8I5KWW8_HUMAN
MPFDFRSLHLLLPLHPLPLPLGAHRIYNDRSCERALCR